MNRRRLLPILVPALWALVLTWPLARELDRSIPLGSERSTTVPFFNLWTLGWNINRLAHGYAGYWDAPIFHPVRNAFAFSEPQPLTGLLAAPLWPLGPAVAYNLVLLLFLVLNGLCAYGLLRRLGLSPDLCLLGALLAQALPFLSQERGVLQLVPFFGLLWVLNGLWSFQRGASWSSGLFIGLGLVLTFLTSENYALFLGLLLLPAGLFWLPELKRPAAWPAVLLAMAIAAFLILPLALPQHAALEKMGFSRSTGTLASGSAKLSDYLRPSSQIWESQWFPLALDGGQQLFPGVILIALATAGAVAGLSQKRLRRWTGYLITATGVAFVLSFGLNLELGGVQPYEWLRAYLPGFDNLRSPFRLAYLFQIYLWALSALALLWLQDRGHRAIAALLLLAALFEFFPRPARLTPLPAPLETRSLAGPVLFLPFAPGPETSAFIDTTSWMVGTMADPLPMVNGYSGYFPGWQRQLRSLLSDFPTSTALAALRTLGVKTVLIHQDWMDEGQRHRLAAMAKDGHLRPAGGLGRFAVYEIAGAGLKPLAAYKGNWLLEAENVGSEIELRARAAVTDEQVYLLAPEIAPLRWRVQLTTPVGEAKSHQLTPPGSLLFYRGSNRSIRFRLPRPDVPGPVTVVLRDSKSDQILARETLAAP